MHGPLWRVSCFQEHGHGAAVRPHPDSRVQRQQSPSGQSGRQGAPREQRLSYNAIEGDAKELAIAEENHTKRKSGENKEAVMQLMILMLYIFYLSSIK